MHIECFGVGPVLALAGALQWLRRLERLDFALTFHKVTNWRIPGFAEYALATALQNLPQLAELRLHNIRLDTDDLRATPASRR